MMMDERCPDCDYKFNKEETLAMIAHCPFCLGDRLVTRARPYFGEPAEDSSQEAFSELMKAQGRCLEMEVQHISFGSLRDTFDTFASGNRFELACKDCGKELHSKGACFILLMKDQDEPHPVETLRTEKEPRDTSVGNDLKRTPKNPSKKKGCAAAFALCIIVTISLVVISHIL